MSLTSWMRCPAACALCAALCTGPVLGCSRARSIDVAPLAPIHSTAPQSLPRATVKDAAGTVLDDVKPTFSVEPASIGHVFGGNVVCDDNGEAWLRASVPGDSIVGRTALSCRLVDDLHVDCEPSGCKLVLGGAPGALRLRATFHGSPVTDVRPVVRSHNTGIVRIDAGNTLTAVEPGTTTVDVEVGDHSISRTVIVKAKPDRIVIACAAGAGPVTDAGCYALHAGGTFALQARVYGGALELPEERPTWRSSEPGVVSVNDAGTATAVDRGTALLRASVGDIFTDVRVSVLRGTPPRRSTQRECKGDFPFPVAFHIVNYYPGASFDGTRTKKSESITEGGCETSDGDSCMNGLLPPKGDVDIEMLRAIGDACCCKF